MHHIQITFHDIQPEQQEWVIAHLIEAGYEGFEENDLELKAFINEENFDKQFLQELAFKYQLNFDVKKISEQNWNELWESNFQPVIVDDFVCIRANFHSTASSTKHDIVITPKMSFGTGHHATTYMMVKAMQQINFENKTVIDFGTGTGVLAILAEILGANKIIGIDNDNWSISNARENVAVNQCIRVVIENSDSLEIFTNRFDIILANINRNVLLEHMKSLANHLNVNGILLVSGILKSDEIEMINAAQVVGLDLVEMKEKDNWICLKFGC